MLLQKCIRGQFIKTAFFIGVTLGSLLSLSGCATAPSAAGLPQNPEASAHYSMGNSFLHSGDFGMAINEYEKATAIEPTSASAYLNLGIALLCHGDYEYAASSLKTADKIRPGYARTTWNLAHALYATGKFREAAIEYETVYSSGRIGPTYLPLALSALSLMHSGQTAKAQEMLQGAISSPWMGFGFLRYYGVVSVGQYGLIVTGYLLGNRTEQELLAKVPTEDERNLVLLIIGINQAVNGQDKQAVESLGMVLDKAKPGWLYGLARTTLQQIQQSTD